MTVSADAALLKAVMNRFNDDYFIHGLGKHGYYCIPNFVFKVEEGALHIQWLGHVSEADQAAMTARLAGLTYVVIPERLTLEEIETRTGKHFPDPPAD